MGFFGSDSSVLIQPSFPDLCSVSSFLADELWNLDLRILCSWSACVFMVTSSSDFSMVLKDVLILVLGFWRWLEFPARLQGFGASVHSAP